MRSHLVICHLHYPGNGIGIVEQRRAHHRFDHTELALCRPRILHPALFGRRLPRRLISLASIPLRFARRRRGDGRGDAVATSIAPHSVQLLQIPFARPISPYFQTLATGFEPRCPSERLTAGNMDVRPPAMASDGNEIAHNLVALAGGDEPDRKSTRLTPVTNAHLVCRLRLEKKNT